MCFGMNFALMVSITRTLSIFARVIGIIKQGENVSKGIQNQQNGSRKNCGDAENDEPENGYGFSSFKTEVKYGT